MTVSRRKFLAGAAAGGVLALAPAVGSGSKVSTTRAIRCLHDALDRGSCAHYAFVASCLGPWATIRADGRDLLRQLERIPCSTCKEVIPEVAQRLVRGLPAEEEVPEPPEAPPVDINTAIVNLLDHRKFYQAGAPLEDACLLNASSPEALALQLFQHDPVVSVAESALKILLRPLGFAVSSSSLLWHFVHGLCRVSAEAGVCHASAALAKELEQAAIHHRHGAIRALCRQALGDVKQEDYLTLLAFDAAGKAERLDSLPASGSLSGEQARQVLLQVLQHQPLSQPAIVGLALLRDRSSFTLMKTNFKGAVFHNRAGLLMAGGALALLDYERGLPIFCRVADKPASLAEDDHYYDQGRIFNITGSGQPFPFLSFDQQELHRLLSDAELASYAKSAAVYECRIESLIELARRPAIRREAASLACMMRQARSTDLVRLFDALTATDPALAAAQASAALGHPSWEVRAAAAAAIIKDAFPLT